MLTWNLGIISYSSQFVNASLCSSVSLFFISAFKALNQVVILLHKNIHPFYSPSTLLLEFIETIPWLSHTPQPGRQGSLWASPHLPFQGPLYAITPGWNPHSSVITVTLLNLPHCILLWNCTHISSLWVQLSAHFLLLPFISKSVLSAFEMRFYTLEISFDP